MENQGFVDDAGVEKNIVSEIDSGVEKNIMSEIESASSFMLAGLPDPSAIRKAMQMFDNYHPSTVAIKTESAKELVGVDCDSTDKDWEKSNEEVSNEEVSAMNT